MLRSQLSNTLRTYIRAFLSEAKGWWDEEQEEDIRLSSGMVVDVSGTDSVAGHPNTVRVVIEKNVLFCTRETWLANGRNSYTRYILERNTNGKFTLFYYYDDRETTWNEECIINADVYV